MMRILVVLAVFLACGVLPWSRAAGAEKRAWRVIPVGRLGLQVWQGDSHLFSVDSRLPGPDQSYAGMEPMPAVDGDTRVYEQEVTFTRSRWDSKVVAGPLSFRYEALQTGPKTLQIRARCSAEEAVRLQGVEVTVPVSDYLTGARIQTGGGAEVGTLGEGGGRPGDEVRSLSVTTTSGATIRFELGTPARVHYDPRAVHIWLLRGTVRGGQPAEGELTVTFPQSVEFSPENQLVDTSDWFLYGGEQDFSPGSAVGMEDWLDRPAGGHGYVRIEGNRFTFEDGTPVKFWGTNISWADMALPDEQAERYAAKFAKHGVNIVRMHKFMHEHSGLDGWPFDASATWDGILDPDNPLEFHDGAVGRFDNMHAELKERGVYVGWSPIAFFAFHEAYRDRLIDYDELKAVRDANPFWIHGGNTMYPFSTFAPDVQDLYIELITKLLNHVNPRTGLRYAEDPALAFVEFRNEAAIFFWGVNNLAAESPVYRRILAQKFCDWLRERYASEEALRDSWTEIGLKEGESLQEGTIFPFPEWGRINQMPRSRRLVDSYRFLFEYQDHYYQRFVRAVRATGYKGPLVGSCWQAADWLGHLYNLQNDRRVGIIDRHGYHRMLMLGQPGTGALNSGRNVVSDRPFALSEWAGSHVYAAEVSPLVGLIGLGLQGWDSSMQYGSNWWGIATHARTGIHSTSEAFHHIGQWPFISRILRSGALREGKVVARRRVSMEDLYPLEDESADDFELLGGTSWEELEREVPREALAIGRVEVEFVEEPVEEKLKMGDLNRYWDRERRLIRASNGQIVWDYSGRGFFTVDTDAGQAVIGFGGGEREHALSDVSIAYDAPFANVYVVPRRPGETLANARSLVVMVLGRTADEGDVLEETTITPLATADRPHPGGGRQGAIRHWIENPVLLFEPVRATLTLRRDEAFRVYALDHDGRLPRPPHEVPVTRTQEGLQFTLDGARYDTMYYLVEFDRGN